MAKYRIKAIELLEDGTNKAVFHEMEDKDCVFSGFVVIGIHDKGQVVAFQDVDRFDLLKAITSDENLLETAKAAAAFAVVTAKLKGGLKEGEDDAAD